jgi:tetraacyldisaccharide 4'-kinase
VKARPWLLPLGAAFGAGAALRAGLYSRGVLRQRRLAGPVISVGNLAVGGRGKTPLAARIATLLRDAGLPVAILSRGYGGLHDGGPLLVSDGETVYTSSAMAGDEPYALVLALPGVAVAVARRRFDAGRLVETRLGPHVHVLDDGFQHLALARALDIVSVRPSDLHDRPLPAGPLRERPSALDRADLVLVDVSAGGAVPAGLDPARTLAWRRRSLGFSAIDGTPAAPPPRAFLLAAIADPERLVSDVEAHGVRVVGRAFYRDHHRYTGDETNRAVAAARAAGADAVVSTEKDRMRLPWLAGAIPFLVHRIEAVVEDEARLRDALLRAAGTA